MKQIKTALFTLFFLFCSQSYGAGSQASIAVFPFHWGGDINEVLEIKSSNSEEKNISIRHHYELNALTDKFVSRLVNTRKFQVVERSRMSEIMSEYNLSEAKNLVNVDRAIAKGNLLIADYIVIGSIRNLTHSTTYKAIPYIDQFSKIATNSLSVDMRVIDTRTGQIVAAKSDVVSDTQRSEVRQRGKKNSIMNRSQFNSLADKLSKRLVQQVIDAVYPIKIVAHKSNVIFLNRGKGHDISVGNVLAVYQSGEQLIDPDTGLALGVEETKVGTIQVTDLLEKFSKAVVKSGSGPFKKGSICRQESSSKVVVKKKVSGKSHTKPTW